ncbi:MAG: tRNA pseudouridine(55) synthase TruB [Bacteroidota bacterium]
MADYNEGTVLLINKPYEWTSFDVVKKLRNVTRAKKVGHAGTLDPLATGLLIVCTGKFTKQISIIQDAEKEYTGTFFMGATTPSADRETEVNHTFDITGLTNEAIYNTTKQFTGTIMQVPPLHSAVKVDGERAYKIARRGEEHKLNAKQITIKEFEITDISLPYIKFKVVCSKGTYIRSLADDFGKALNNGAYLYDLCRTRIGTYLLADAMEMKDVQSLAPAKITE